MSAFRHSDANLQSDDALARSEVVANAAMNRERNLAGPNSYARDLGFDVWDFLQVRRGTGQETVRWLDLCCGTGRALIQTVRLLAEGTEELGRVAIVGVDLVPLFDPVATSGISWICWRERHPGLPPMESSWGIWTSRTYV